MCAAQSIRAADVITVVEAAMERYGRPRVHRLCDPGLAQTIQDWLKECEVKTIYIKPGSPWENAYIESFHDKPWDGCLNRGIFDNLLEARVVIEPWRCEYNHQRPHSSLDDPTPEEFAASCLSTLRPQVATAPSDSLSEYYNHNQIAELQL